MTASEFALNVAAGTLATVLGAIATKLIFGRRRNKAVRTETTVRRYRAPSWHIWVIGVLSLVMPFFTIPLAREMDLQGVPIFVKLSMTWAPLAFFGIAIALWWIDRNNVDK